MYSNLKLIFFSLIFLAVILELIADVMLKKWAIGNRNLFFIAGLVIYFLGTLFWAVSLKYEFLSKAGAIFTILNLIAISLAGIIMFKEDLSLTNKIGVALGVLSIILIEL